MKQARILGTAAVSRPRGRRPKDAAAGRQALIQAGISAFARHGFEAADLRGIAAAAGVSQNLVRVHFGSKAQFWEACLDTVVALAEPAQATVRAIAQDPDKATFERLRDVLRAIAGFSAIHPDIRDFVTRYGTEAPERLEMLTERLLRPTYETVRELYARGIEEGIVRSAHPALFFTLANNALNPPSMVPALLHSLEPRFHPQEVRAIMTETVIATLLHRPD